jgi:Na+-transporting NADH:ubiquinone oxidoreductase subunit A
LSVQKIKQNSAMSRTIKIRKGLDIKLKGKAELNTKTASSASAAFGIKPADFQGLTPKLSVKADDTVKIGTPLFHDKSTPDVCFTSPVSGKVVAINRGERRRILEVVVESDGKFESESFQVPDLQSASSDAIKQILLNSGLWPFVIQRPFGVIAKPGDKPRDIFISGFDSAPLAADYDYIFGPELDAIELGIKVLAKLTDGKVYLGVRPSSKLASVKGAEIVAFEGPHPAGNVGIQIHKVKPINKGEVVWTVQLQALIFIGKLFKTGKLDFSKTVVLTGSEVKAPRYLKTILGAEISSLVKGNTKGTVNERIISGNVLTGTKVGINDFLGFYNNQITVIPEGNEVEPFGWISPGFTKYSPSSTFLSKVFPKKEYVLNANFHGGERAFVLSGQYEKVFPMDILPVYLLKAIIVNDIDKMEQLGIYEVIEEDMALCEYVCTSKIEVQETLRKGINVMLKEMA